MAEKMQDYFIEGVCFENSLSFEHFILVDFKRINVFIGGNSSGKSNVIRAIIGFVHNSTGHICFADGTCIDHPLNKSKYHDRYFEIPPFRNLVIPEECDVKSENWRSGTIDLQKIIESRDQGKEFYEELEQIIGIKGFRLCGRAGMPNPGLDWTNWGYYCREVKGRAKELPIDNLGWGTKSAIIIFYNIFFNEEAIVFIEEPEISMHPQLLKNLFTWAFKRRTCQFFITTHSSMLIDKVFLGEDAKDISLYEICNEEGITRGRNLNNKLDQIRMLEQLGFQSSNLLFTNYVIWVEGPSDIFYYEALLNIMDKLNGGKDIKRGIHYELMWYGGRQVKNMIDIESAEGLNLLFSFGRKGGIFWDYDGKDDYARDLARRIKNFKVDIEQKSNSSLFFHFGCTGKMMTGDETNLPTNGLPITIENLMSKESAKAVLKLSFPNIEDYMLDSLVGDLEKNEELEDDHKKKIGPRKRALGIAFLDLINKRLESCEAADVMRFAIATERCGTIGHFFDELYQNIINANGA